MITVTPIVRWGQRVTGVHGPNERVIELPLAFEVLALETPGRVLDAGCACNQDYPDPVAKITHLTQNLEHERLRAQPNRFYQEGDIRDRSRYTDQFFDRVVCISTLEHVGMDNRHYGGPEESNPESVVQAVAELWRVCAGTLLITVPVHHQPCMTGKWRYFTPETLDSLIPPGLVADVDYERVFYVKHADGWMGPFNTMQPSDPMPRPIKQIVAIKLWR